MADDVMDEDVAVIGVGVDVVVDVDACVDVDVDVDAVMDGVDEDVEGVKDGSVILRIGDGSMPVVGVDVPRNARVVTSTRVCTSSSSSSSCFSSSVVLLSSPSKSGCAYD